MTALVKWTQDKLRLARYRHGWGVVCGLDVHCDPMKPASVMVKPGYAVSCCGDDIIVCTEDSVDLSGQCTTKVDDCLNLAKSDKPDAVQIDFGKYQVLASDVRVVDLYLRYVEKPSDPTTALGRGTCHQTVPCEYTRDHESYDLAAEAATQLGNPFEAAAELWLNEYKKCLNVIEIFQEKFISLFREKSGTADDGRKIRDWLLNWIHDHPLGEFCFVRDWICSLDLKNFPEERVITQILFWLVQDCRNHFLQCACFSCTPDKGVPLARIWLHASLGKGPPSCRVLRIDPFPPYRRPIQADCWPAPWGYINLGRLIWHNLREATSILCDLGMDTGGAVPFAIPDKISELRNSLDCPPSVDCDGEPSLQYYELSQGDLRVVGFCGRRHVEPAIPGDGVEPIASGGVKPVAPVGGVKPDDLTQVDNIRDKRAKVLNDAGIFSYEQIVRMSPNELRNFFPLLAEGTLQEIIDSAKKLATEKPPSDPK
jgi:hypothetical protein